MSWLIELYFIFFPNIEITFRMNGNICMVTARHDGLRCQDQLVNCLIQAIQVIIHSSHLPSQAVLFSYLCIYETGTRESCQEYQRSEEHTSDLQSLMRTSYDAYCFK